MGAMNDATREKAVPEGFATRLRLLRRQRLWSQKELGKRVGLHHTHISRYEMGTSRPTADALRRMAEALGVPGDYLLAGEEAAEQMQNADLMARFRKVAKLPPEDQAVVLQFLDAFIVRREIEGVLRRSPGERQA
jgi:transcriptional regulator with XRE-family HTH domain